MGSTGKATTLKGMTQAEEKTLHDLAMASLVWRDDYAGTNVTTEEERQQYRLPWKNGGAEFEREQFNILKTIAERNGAQDNFTFDDIRALVRTKDRRYEIKGDDYALARGNVDRKWIVDEYDIDSTEFYKPIIQQTRFKTPQEAIAFVVKKKKSGQ